MNGSLAFLTFTDFAARLFSRIEENVTMKKKLYIVYYLSVSPKQCCYTFLFRKSVPINAYPEHWFNLVSFLQITELFSETKEDLKVTSEKLEVTEQNLEETTETLRVTGEELKVTKEDRNEQKYLVDVHVENETSLYSEANQVNNIQ